MPPITRLPPASAPLDDADRRLLAELLRARGPPGQEYEAALGVNRIEPDGPAGIGARRRHWADEYGTSLDRGPIVIVSDEKGAFDKLLSDELVDLGIAAGLEPQAALVAGFASDASAAAAAGMVARAAVLAVLTISTHSFEMIRPAGVEALVRLLELWLCGDGDPLQANPP